jgi:hypothetical protein
MSATTTKRGPIADSIFESLKADLQSGKPEPTVRSCAAIASVASFMNTIGRPRKPFSPGVDPSALSTASPT